MKNNPLIIYTTEDGKIKIETHFENETVWLNIEQIAELFQKAKTTISEHIKNIFKEGEFEKPLVVRDFRTTIQHGAIKGLTINDELLKQAGYGNYFDEFLVRIRDIHCVLLVIMIIQSSILSKILDI